MEHAPAFRVSHQLERSDLPGTTNICCRGSHWFPASNIAYRSVKKDSSWFESQQRTALEGAVAASDDSSWACKEAKLVESFSLKRNESERSIQSCRMQQSESSPQAQTDACDGDDGDSLDTHFVAFLDYHSNGENSEADRQEHIRAKPRGRKGTKTTEQFRRLTNDYVRERDQAMPTQDQEIFSLRVKPQEPLYKELEDSEVPILQKVNRQTTGLKRKETSPTPEGRKGSDVGDEATKAKQCSDSLGFSPSRLPLANSAQAPPPAGEAQSLPHRDLQDAECPSSREVLTRQSKDQLDSAKKSDSDTSSLERVTLRQTASTPASSAVTIPTAVEATHGAAASEQTAKLREVVHDTRRAGASSGRGHAGVQVAVPTALTRVKSICRGTQDLKPAVHQHAAAAEKLRRLTQKGCNHSTVPKNCRDKGASRLRSRRSDFENKHESGKHEYEGRGSTPPTKRSTLRLRNTGSKLQAGDRQLSEKSSPDTCAVQAREIAKHLDHTADRASGYHHDNNDKQEKLNEPNEVSAAEAKEQLHLESLNERLKLIKERRGSRLQPCEAAKGQDGPTKEDASHMRPLPPRSRSLQHLAAHANGSEILSSAACGSNCGGESSKETQRHSLTGISHRSRLRQLCLKGPAEGGKKSNIHGTSFSFLRSYAAGVACKQQIAAQRQDNVSVERKQKQRPFHRFSNSSVALQLMRLLAGAQSVRDQQDQQGLTRMRDLKAAPSNAPFKLGRHALEGREQQQQKGIARLGNTSSTVETGHQETAMCLKSITPSGPGLLLRKACSDQLKRMNRNLSRDLPSLLPIQRRLEEQVERTLSSVDWLEQRVAYLTQKLCLQPADPSVSAAPADSSGKRFKARIDMKRSSGRCADG
ncbi:hypothetical protein Emed_003291 [Eimeria media]